MQSFINLRLPTPAQKYSLGMPPGVRETLNRIYLRSRYLQLDSGPNLQCFEM